MHVRSLSWRPVGQRRAFRDASRTVVRGFLPRYAESPYSRVSSPCHQFAEHLRVVRVGCRHLCATRRTASTVRANVQLHPEMPALALLSLMHLAIPNLGLGGCRRAMIVASTIVPPPTLMPAARNPWLVLINRASPRLCCSSKRRNFSNVVASGARSFPRSIPAKLRNAALSYSASSHASSAKLNQCWRK
jgi:hypothetical protein